MDLKLGSEYRDVAMRREHLGASGKSAQDLAQLITLLENVSEAVYVSYKPRPLSPDPDDDMILDLALNGRVEAIVTQNRKHFMSAARPFSIDVLSPLELLNRIRKKEKVCQTDPLK